MSSVTITPAIPGINWIIPSHDSNDSSASPIILMITLIGIALLITKVLCSKNRKPIASKWEGISAHVQEHLLKIDAAAVPLMIEAHKFKSKYRQTHFVLAHAQSHQWSFFNDVIRGIHKRENPSRNWSQHQLAFPAIDRPLTKKEIFSQKHFDDGNHRGKLLSVDAYFWNKTPAESMLYFLCLNKSNSELDSSKVYSIVHRLLGLPLGNTEYFDEIQAIAKKVIECANKKKLESKVAALYLLLVEKNSDKLYRAHLCGPPCTCHKGKDLEILEELQDDRLSLKSRCWSVLHPLNSFHYPIPQFRIIIDNNMPIQSYRLDTLSVEKRLFYERSAERISDEILALKSRIESARVDEFLRTA